MNENERAQRLKELGDKYGRVILYIDLTEAERAYLRELIEWERNSKKANDLICGPYR